MAVAYAYGRAIGVDGIPSLVDTLATQGRTTIKLGGADDDVKITLPQFALAGDAYRPYQDEEDRANDEFGFNQLRTQIVQAMLLNGRMEHLDKAEAHTWPNHYWFSF